MGNVLLAASLNENLQEIINKLSELMDSFWIYIVMALAAVVGRIRRHPNCRCAQERGEDQRKGYGEKPHHRNSDHFRSGDGCAASHQRTVRMGRIS